MKNLSIKNSLFCALLCITPLILSSCLSGGENQISSRVQVGLELQSLDDTLRAGQDSILIDNIRLILGESYLLESEDSLFINRSESPSQIDFDEQSANPVLLARGAFPEGTYEQIKLTIPKAPTESSGLIRDHEDFVEGDIRYTLIVEGTYNGETFTYKSERVFEPEFPFQPAIEVPEFNQAFAFLITNDVAGWFLSGNGLLDPSNPDNSTEINDNIDQLFTIDIPE